MDMQNLVVKSSQKREGLFVTIGERIKEVRRQIGLTQNEFGQKVGIHARQLGKYEAGIGRPSIENLAKISKFSDVSLDYLVFGEEKQTAKRTNIFDNELVNLLRRIDRLDKAKRDKLKWTLEALLDRECKDRFKEPEKSKGQPHKIAQSV